jgi:microcin C transport system substrate-binding protein
VKYASFSALLAAAVFAPALALAEPRHGLSAFGELKYPTDFTHFSYVNPGAPKGGEISTLRTVANNSFDSFNAFVLKGDPAQGLDRHLFDTLMVRAYDEPDAVYGLVAETADVAADGLSVVFRLRPEARFSDGTPVTADDVAYSFEALKADGDPSFRVSLRDVVSATALDTHTVKYEFTGENARDLPITVALLPVLSRAFYQTQEFKKADLTEPMASGPYKIGKYRQGSFITYVRRDDYWAKDLPVNRGRHNFGRIKYLYFTDRNAGMLAFKGADYDLREEFTSKTWATEYTFPAVTKGWVKIDLLPDATPSGTQGYFINTRREKFADIRIRQAIDLAFDYEWINRNIFYGAYARTDSFFENSDMQATGLPSAGELAVLEPFRDRLPPEVFAEPYVPPVTDGSGRLRKSIRKAGKLLDAAGWKTAADGIRQNVAGDRLTLEILMFSRSFDRVNGPYVENLKLLGIEAKMRLVDSAQFQRRVEDFDFDVTTSRFGLRPTPGAEMRNYWTTSSADIKGSRNLAGINNPVIDALTEKVIGAGSRADLVDAARALDRVLRAGNYWVSHWYLPSHRIAWYDKFSRPDTKPPYDRAILDTWWFDAAKATALASARSK